MKTHYSVVSLLAALSSAEIVADEPFNQEEDSYCCILYASADYLIDTENTESVPTNEYSKVKVCAG